MLKDLEEVGVDRGGRKIEDADFGERLGAQPSNVASKCQVSGATARVGAGARSAAKTGAEVARPMPRRITQAYFRIRAPIAADLRRRYPNVRVRPEHPPCDCESKPPNAHVRRFLTMGSLINQRAVRRDSGEA